MPLSNAFENIKPENEHLAQYREEKLSKMLLKEVLKKSLIIF